MPIYEYRCGACHEVSEVLQGRDDPAPAKCPACGMRKKLVKMMSVTSFQLKGGGWYKDLYASAKPSAGGSEEKPVDKPVDKPAAEAAPIKSESKDKPTQKHKKEKKPKAAGD